MKLPTLPSLPQSAPRAERARPKRLKGLVPWLLGLLVLIAGVTAIGAWNEKRQPRTDFEIGVQDLAPDPLATSQLSETPAEAASASTAPSEGRVRISASDVNIRSAPSRQAKVVARPRAGALYKLSGASRQAEGLEWVGLLLEDGSEAWVGARFVAAAGTAQAPSPATAKAPDTAAGGTTGDDINQAAAVVSKLLLAPGQIWPKADPVLRELTVRALLQKIFKDGGTRVTPEHAKALDTCMQASSADKQLAALKVYELAAACALGLGWR